MKVLCKRNFYGFNRNYNYKVISICSVFEKNDFITIQDITGQHIRFRLNKSKDYVDNFIGEFENYFYDYFYDVPKSRKEKILNLIKL